MKKMVLILVTWAWACGISTGAQERGDEWPLRKALEAIENRHHVRFSFVDRLVDGVYVAMPDRLEDLQGSLVSVLDGSGLRFQFLDPDHILIFKDVGFQESVFRRVETVSVQPSLERYHRLADQVLIPDSLPMEKPMDIRDTVVIIKADTGRPVFQASERFFHFGLWRNIHTGPDRPSTSSVSMNVLSFTPIYLQGIELGIIGNFGRSRMEGVQVAVGGNSSAWSSGVQAALGSNVTTHAMNGVQWSVGYNAAAGVRGFQLGMVNKASQVDGVQIGMVSLAHDQFQGIQTSAGFSSAGDLVGVQVGGVTSAQRIKGLQIGVLNLAKKVDGLQVGIVNIAEDHSGAAIGLLNFVKNGLHQVEISANESRMTHIAYKHGTRRFFTMYDLGLHRLEKPARWSAGIGMGVMVFEKDRYNVLIDAGIHKINEDKFWDRKVNLLSAVRLVPAIRLFDRVSLLAGASANVFVSRTKDGSALSRHHIYNYDRKRTYIRGWFGYVAGVRIS